MRRRRIALLVITVAFAALLALLAQAGGVLRGAELSVLDTHFTLRGDRAAPSEVVVVAIDDVTFGELRQRWPFSRTLHARMVDRLHAAGARAIGYDVQFTEPTSAAADNALIEAVGRAGNVVLSTTEVAPGGQVNVFGGNDVLRQIGAHAASTNFRLDGDGAIRRFAYAVEGLRTFPVVLAGVMSGRPVPRFAGTRLIDFAGPPRAVRTVSFSRVLRGEVPATVFRGKIVIVGAAAPSLQDVHTTSASRSEPMSGPEIEANALDTLLRGQPLHEAPGWADVLVILVLAAIVPLLARAGRATWRIPVIGIAVGAAYTATTQIAFGAGLVLPLTYPLLALAVATVGTLGVNYAFASFERERVRDIFSRFVPDTVVDDVLAVVEAGDGLRLGGRRCVATVMFCDLRGFTSFSEQLPPTRVIEIVNVYLGEMSEAILAAGGTLVSYMGDGIMAVFGAPLEQPDHADRAFRAAREMMGTRLGRFNAWLAEHGHERRFRMGVGLNSGEVMAGNVGSERRMEFTAIGDTTNTASRLEGMTKHGSHMLFMADTTRTLLTAPPDDLQEVGTFEVRGRREPMRVWSVPDPVDAGRPPPEPVVKASQR